MFVIIDNMRQLNFSHLADVYEQSLNEDAATEFNRYGENHGYFLARQSFYDYLSSCFFKQESAVYAVWMLHDRYAAALRLEAYKDGLLITALETDPKMRRKGYAESLIHSVVDHMRCRGVSRLYSHVEKRNIASFNLHNKCGFLKIHDHAVFVDGSVSHASITMCLEL